MDEPSGTSAPAISAEELPPDRRRLLAELDDLDRAFDGLWRERDERGRAERPDPGSWSLVEIVHHVAETDGQYFEAMREAVERRELPPARGPVRAGFLEGLFVSFLEPPARWRMPAPRAVRPPVELDPDEVWRSFREVHGRLGEWILATGRLDLNRVRFADPLAPLIPLRVGTGLLVILAHGRRHLHQALRAAASTPEP